MHILNYSLVFLCTYFTEIIKSTDIVAAKYFPVNTIIRLEPDKQLRNQDRHHECLSAKLQISY